MESVNLAMKFHVPCLPFALLTALGIVHADIVPVSVEPRDSSPNSNRLVPVETVVFSEKTANASAHLTLEVGGKP